MAGSAEMRLQYTGTHALLIKAETCLGAGRAEAAALASEGLELAQAHGYRALEATALRLLGRLAEAREIATTLGLAPELARIEAVSR